MGSVGDCFDNALAESVSATLTTELLARNPFATRAQARTAIFDTSRRSTARSAATPHSATSHPPSTNDEPPRTPPSRSPPDPRGPATAAPRRQRPGHGRGAVQPNPYLQTQVNPCPRERGRSTAGLPSPLVGEVSGLALPLMCHETECDTPGHGHRFVKEADPPKARDVGLAARDPVARAQEPRLLRPADEEVEMEIGPVRGDRELGKPEPRSAPPEGGIPALVVCLTSAAKVSMSLMSRAPG